MRRIVAGRGLGFRLLAGLALAVTPTVVPGGCGGDKEPPAGQAPAAAGDGALLRVLPGTATASSLERLAALPGPAMDGRCPGYAEPVAAFVDTLRGEARRLAQRGESVPRDAVGRVADWLGGRAQALGDLAPPPPAVALHRELAASVSDLADSFRALAAPAPSAAAAAEAAPAGPRLLNAVGNLTTTLSGLEQACAP